jgi:hypothetical protein
MAAVMPFRSEKQRRALWAKRPDIARRWTKRYGPKPKPKRTRKR